MSLLLDLVKEQVTSAAIDKISDFLGEGRGNTSNAITAAIPTLLGFLSKKTETTEGASSLINMATNSDLLSMFAGNSFDKVFEGNRDGLMSKGNSMLIDLFGNKEADLSSEISKYANIGKESSDGILASILPLVMSVLGNKITSGGLNASNLTSLFEGEKESIFGAIPAGLASLAGLLGLGKIGDAVSGIASASVDAVSDGVKNVADSTKQAVSDTTSYVSGGDNNNGGGFMKWLLPLLGILAALALLWFLMKGCNKEKEEVDENTTTVVANPTDFATYTLNDAKEVVNLEGVALTNGEGNPIVVDGVSYKFNDDNFVLDGDDSEFTLDMNGKAIKIGDVAVVTERTLGDVAMGDVKLQAYPGGIEEQLISFINSDEYKNATNEELKEKWFNFDDLNFEFGTTTLTPESKRQLDNIVAILKAFPDVKMKLGAYTDKKGDDTSNLKLSQKRADAVKAALESNGVGSQITGAEGYGEQFATVAEDASDKEREADRKTAVRLSK